MNLETARIPTFTAARQRLVYTGLSGYRSNNGRVLYQIPLGVAREICYNRPPYEFPSFEMGENDMNIKDIAALEDEIQNIPVKDDFAHYLKNVSALNPR